MSIYLHDWAESGFLKMVADFEDIYTGDTSIGLFMGDECPWPNEDMWEEKKGKLLSVLSSGKYDDIHVLLASYTYESYSGDAFVLFEKGGKFYEVSGSHCSCFGLGGQWEPEDTTVEALLHRLNEGRLGAYDSNKFDTELRAVLEQQKA